MSIIYYKLFVLLHGYQSSLTSLPILSSTVTMMLSSSPWILGDDNRVPIIVGVMCFVIFLLTITLIIVILLFVCQMRQKRKLNVSSSKDRTEHTRTNQLYSQEKPAKHILTNLLHTGNSYQYSISRFKNWLEVSMSVLYLLYKPSTTFNYKSNPSLSQVQSKCDDSTEF